MKRFTLALLFSAVSLLAGDAGGKWSGTLTIPTPEGTKTDDAYVVLKQDGATITGTAGKDESEQREIRNGKIEGDVVTFELATGESAYKLTLKLEGDTLAGDIVRERDGKTENAKIALKRVK